MDARREARRFIYGFSVGMLVVGIFLFVGISLVGGFALSRLQSAQAVFEEAAGRSAISIFPEIVAGYQSGATNPIAASRWLVLGKDEVEGSGRGAVLTDSMILVTYRPLEGSVNLLSLPRDWYHPEYATKINALYTYGLDRSPNQPTFLVEAAMKEMLGVPLDHVVELSLEDVRGVIEVVGGIQVDVRRAFTDERFPRSGVDVTTETDPAVLYETVSFPAGLQVMDGETALKFMRSRHSTDLEEGNDEARVRRQQQVIEALVSALSSPQVVGDPLVLGRLYRWYADKFQSEVSLFELGRLAGSMAKSKKVPQMRKIDLPLVNTAIATEEAALLVHPPTNKYNQWVYEAEDPTFAEIHRFVQENGL